VGSLNAGLANIPRCLIGMETCSGSHHIGRQLAALGHDVRLIPAQYVKPFLKGHKNDYRDAEAIAEAVQRPTMNFVANQDAGADGPAGFASRALAPRGATDGCEQSNPRLPD
jgi:transposase